MYLLLIILLVIIVLLLVCSCYYSHANKHEKLYQSESQYWDTQGLETKVDMGYTMR